MVSKRLAFAVLALLIHPEAFALDRPLDCSPHAPNPAYYSCSGQVVRGNACGSHPDGPEQQMYEWICRESEPAPLPAPPQQPNLITLTGCVGSPRWHRERAASLTTEFNTRCTRESATGRSDLFFSALSSDSDRMELKRKLYRVYAGQTAPQEIDENATEFEEARQENAITLRLEQLEQSLREFGLASTRQGGMRRMPGINEQLVRAQITAIGRRMGIFRTKMNLLRPNRTPEGAWNAVNRRGVMEQIGWLTTGFSPCEFDAAVCRRRQAGNLEQLIEGIGAASASAEADEIETAAFQAAADLKAKAQTLLQALTQPQESEFASVLQEISEVNQCRALATNRDSNTQSGRLPSCQAKCSSLGGTYSRLPNGTAQCSRGTSHADGTANPTPNPTGVQGQPPAGTGAEAPR